MSEIVGVDQPLVKNEAVKELMNVSKINSIPAYYQDNCRDVGVFYLVGKENVATFLSQYVGDILQECDLSASSLLKKYFGDFNIPVDKVLFYSAEGHYADVYGLTQSMLKNIRLDNLAEVYECMEILDVKTRENSIELMGSWENFLAKKVILATGPWDVNKFGTPTRNKKVAAFHLQNIFIDDEAPAIVFYDEDAFLLPAIEKGHWLL